ncbi:MAG: DnaB-like helicase C-terminal domain-containing protein [Elusimicrobiales bacterium]|nr:DnaB-like helicase C-terminal domain-containing protein [Elusimicrobiales bacterium]
MLEHANQLNIEYCILGTILMEPDHVGEVVAVLNPEHFSTKGTRGLFGAISDLHFDGAPVDPVTALQRAGDDYEPVVREVMQYYTAPSNLQYYCEMLRDTGKLRRIQAEAMVIAGTEKLADVGEALDRMNGMMVSRRNIVIMSAADAAAGFCDRQASDEKPVYLTWGMDDLNKCLYAELGDFIVIGGYPSAGKTLLSIQFAIELAKKYRVGYFSLETSPQKLVDRVMSYLSQVPLAKIKERDLNDADWTALASAASDLAKLSLDLIDAGGMTVRDIQAVALNKHYQVVLVDYLQLVVSVGKGRYEQVTNISQGLHTMARSNNIAVIALAQLSRPEKSDGKPKPPTMSSFRESGQIEQDADVALLLWPSDPNDNRSRRVLKVGKNKEGERIKLELDFDGACQTMKPAEPTKGEQFRAIHKAIREASKVTPGQVKITELQGDNSDLPF